MLKTIKAILILILFAGFVGFLAIGKNYHPKSQDALAQEFGELQCSGPIIPNGEINEEVIELLNVVYKQYQLSSGYLKAVIDNGQTLLAALSQTKDVCDFSKCATVGTNKQPDEVSNVSPKFTLSLNAYVAKGDVGIRPGLCVDSEGVGDPCSIKEISSSIEALKNYQSGFKASFQRIHDVFSTKSEPVTEDTRIKANDYLGRPEETIGTMITKQEKIKRKLEAVEGLIDICSLSELEKWKVKNGKMGNREIKRCIDALKSGEYKYPKPWSEKCEQQCSGGPTESCIDCLGKCEGTSVLARLNCRIYGLKTGDDAPANCSNGKDPSCCGNVCRENYDSPECDECLSRGLSEQESQAWLCGGYIHNWICCSATPLE